ncbi:hypothetical protein TEA_010165 [Camellia sinensis var. sinensis]|uniref:Alpha-1,3-mannosyl-glycoprotein 2-beta-N-acetylglucosaminyltransferase n=1 Tax=Camellia sinensis var. sinensis TaxID=542762 RepID=A0A4S4D1V9_CAMSN|nr:hypothetical protein TEA_010165 [Camellia sinensis var. sinensis]
MGSGGLGRMCGKSRARAGNSRLDGLKLFFMFLRAKRRNNRFDHRLNNPLSGGEGDLNNSQGNGLEKIIDKVQAPVAAVVVMACNRANYLERALKSILKYQSSVPSKYPLFVSQDGEDPDVKTKALSYNQLTYMQHLDHEPVHTESPKEMIVYYKIARHYKWALDQLFYKHNFSRVIILEGATILLYDMEISPDFFDYFEAAVALLESDKSIMAVSSWNDNGQKQFVQDPYMLYRSDFFPGLGWMLAKSTWDELSPKWTKAYPCGVLSHSLLLTLSYFSHTRSYTMHARTHPHTPSAYMRYLAHPFPDKGSSLGQYFKQYLEPIKLNGVQAYLVEDDEDGDGNDNGNGGGRDTQVSITLSIEKIDTEFNVWVLQSSRHSGTTTHHLPEIGADDPSVIYVKAGGEADLDSLIQDAIRLATSVNETCSEACEKSDQLHVVGEQKAASIDKRWSRLLELRNSF